MMKAIGQFIAELLRVILPFLFSEGKKPEEVKPAGYDPELDDAIDQDIIKELEDEK